MTAYILDGHDGVLLVTAISMEIYASDLPTPGMDTLDRCERMADAGLLDRTSVLGGLHSYEITDRGKAVVRAGLMTL